MDSAGAPIVVSSDSSSESEEPSNVPVVPSSSTAANSSSLAQSLLERFRALSSRSCHEIERADRTRAHRAVARRSSPFCPHSKHSFCWNPGAVLP